MDSIVWIPFTQAHTPTHKRLLRPRLTHPTHPTYATKRLPQKVAQQHHKPLGDANRVAAQHQRLQRLRAQTLQQPTGTHTTTQTVGGQSHSHQLVHATQPLCNDLHPSLPHPHPR